MRSLPGTEPPAAPDLFARMEQERDFYRKLLELGENDEIESFLKEALALIVQLTGAARGYVEILANPDLKGLPVSLLAIGRYLRDERVETSTVDVGGRVIVQPRYDLAVSLEYVHQRARLPGQITSSARRPPPSGRSSGCQVCRTWHSIPGCRGEEALRIRICK